MRSLILASLVLLSNGVLAQSVFEKLDKFYVGGGSGIIDANLLAPVGGGDVDLSFNSVELLGGYKHNGYLGADLRIGFGITDEEIDIGGPVDAEIENYYALYWRSETANETAKIYGLLGYASVSVATGDNSESDSGLSYGGGVGFALFDNWNLNFEYRMLVDNDDNEFSFLGFNVDRRF